MDNNDWIKIYSSEYPHRVNILKAVLEENEIEFHELNKRDSTYVMIGEDELYVHAKDSIFAKLLIDQHEL